MHGSLILFIAHVITDPIGLYSVLFLVFIGNL